MSKLDIHGWLDEIVSAIVRRPSKRARELESQRFWDERKAIHELLVARGFRPCFDLYSQPTELFALRDHDLEFTREGQRKVFTGKWAYMHPATNISDLWWRIPKPGRDDLTVN